ncbi:response regulator transcription factor [Halotalea alkalilenta]|uniref:Two-component system response regulator n=1 Tax=Halotalea alkalilenta TaxID=376489 RepID=A0A172YC30_9GAMM|nr:response regulator transcription factor [Halotalea alkalilenta]ANF56778.1 two-component system response regulator [Halotalea alkalilenta]
MYRIALVEDHERVAELIQRALLQVGIETDTFQNTAQASFGLSHADYTVMIVDRGLPDGDGLAWLRDVRAAGNMTPCLMLTARDALHDRIDGLESGADDYLAKPFAMDELIARVRSLMRRPPVLASLAPAVGDLTIDLDNSRLQCKTQSILLAPAELQLMLCLMNAAGRTVRHTNLEHAGWGVAKAVTPNALDVALHRIRKKLSAIGSTARIKNVRGLGYMLTDEPTANE